LAALTVCAVEGSPGAWSESGSSLPPGGAGPDSAAPSSEAMTSVTMSGRSLRPGSDGLSGMSASVTAYSVPSSPPPCQVPPLAVWKVQWSPAGLMVMVEDWASSASA
jgi:hypothetical protein